MDEDVKIDGHEKKSMKEIINTNNKINYEKKRLTELFNNCDEAKRKLVIPLIEQAAYMKVELQNLKQHNIEYGTKEVYYNSPTSWGYKETVESKTYNTMIKNYQNIIKELKDLLPKTDNNSDDGFEDF